MKTLDELYQQMLKRAAEGKPVGVDGDPKLIDCLAHPDDHPLIWRCLLYTSPSPRDS